MVGNNQEGEDGKNQPSPFGGTTVVCVADRLVRGRKEGGESKCDVCEDNNENVCSADAGDEGQAEDDKREGQCRVNGVSPEDLSEDMLGCGWDMLVCLLDDEVDKGRARSGCLCVVGDGRDGGDEGNEDVEETFLLDRQLADTPAARGVTRGTYHWGSPRKECQHNGGEEEDGKTNP